MQRVDFCLFVGYADHRHLHSFPTRRSSDLTDIDSETGQIKVRRYVAVDDCGNILNPLIVDGQVHGGVAQSSTDRKSTRLNSSHITISYAVFRLKKKTFNQKDHDLRNYCLFI